jgi:hypothetical protein
MDFSDAHVISGMPFVWKIQEEAYITAGSEFGENLYGKNLVIIR